jgi:iron complex outermembrane receptor protein
MKISIINTLLVCLLFAYNSISQNSIVGNIKEKESNVNLSGVSIYLSELKIGTTSNDNGDFKIDKIPTGTYLLEISYFGYKKRVERISISSDTIINFTLSEAVSELNEIVVTAVTRSTELKMSPIIIKPIDVSLLNENSSTNLIDALKNVPGVNQITTGAGISKPTIRGLGYNRVISLYNGIRQEGQQWGDEHGIEIDEYSIDRIEIVKGPGSLMYGSDGIAGVLNFITPKAPTDGEIRTQLISNFQSNNQLIGNSISNSGNKNGYQWLGRISNKYAGNYQNKYDGKVYNSGFQELNGNLFLGVNKKWGYSHLNLSSFNTTLNMVEGERDSLGNFIFIRDNGADGEEVSATTQDLKGYKVGFPHQQVGHIRALSNNYFILKKGTLNLDLGFQNNKRKEFGDVLNPTDKALFFDMSTYNYNLRYNLIELKGWESSFGINGMVQNSLNKGLEFLVPEYSLIDLGGFGFTQKTFKKKLTLAGGLRFDSRSLNSKLLVLDSIGVPVNYADSSTSIKFPELQKTYLGFSGSVGISYQLSKSSTLKFNVSRGFRAPNIAEISSNGKHEGTLRYEYGSNTLKSEISHQLDIAYFLNKDHITFEFTPFVNLISNYVYSEKLSSANGGDSIVDLLDPVPAYQFTQGNATLVGGEIYLDLHPHPLDWLHIENSFSFVQATQNNQPDSTKYLPFIPAPKYRAELKAQFKKVGKNLTNSYIKIALDSYFKQENYFKAYSTETATPSYALLSAGIGTTVRAFQNPNFMKIYLSADNLTNVAYQSHLSRLKYAPQNPLTGKNGVYNMGRNISLKVIFNL